MDITFYDQDGTPVAYTGDRQHIYLYSGRPVAYLSDGSVYAYTGKHLGWFNKGWVRDHEGFCVFFTADARGGPMKPMKKMKPMKGIKGMKPMKGMKQMKPMRAMEHSSWSPLSGEQFFLKH
jgi:hypothetical protein